VIFFFFFFAIGRIISFKTRSELTFVLFCFFEIFLHNKTRTLIYAEERRYQIPLTSPAPFASLAWILYSIYLRPWFSNGGGHLHYLSFSPLFFLPRTRNRHSGICEFTWENLLLVTKMDSRKVHGLQRKIKNWSLTFRNMGMEDGESYPKTQVYKLILCFI
jgi:hypothetical protein